MTTLYITLLDEKVIITTERIGKVLCTHTSHISESYQVWILADNYARNLSKERGQDTITKYELK